MKNIDKEFDEKFGHRSVDYHFGALVREIHLTKEIKAFYNQKIKEIKKELIETSLTEYPSHINKSSIELIFHKYN